MVFIMIYDLTADRINLSNFYIVLKNEHTYAVFFNFEKQFFR